MTLVIDKIEKAIKSSPQYGILEKTSGEEALRLLSKRVLDAKVVQNTKLFPTAPPTGYSKDAMDKWHSALNKGVKSGLYFREVISSGWEEMAQERLEKWEKLKGEYEVTMINPCEIPSLNFTILKYRDNSEEVWFGWIMSPTYGFDRPCFISKEANLITVFENWFDALFSHGKQILLKKESSK